MLNFCDIVKVTPLEGDKVKIESLVDKDIVVTGYKVTNSKYKSKGTDFCTKIRFYYSDDESKTSHIVFTGSDILRDQLEEVGKYIADNNQPFEVNTRIVHIGNYYSFK